MEEVEASSLSVSVFVSVFLMEEQEEVRSHSPQDDNRL